MARARKPKYEPEPTAVKEEGQPIKIKHIIKAKNPTQTSYIELLRTKQMVIGAGPAGSGKTWIATYTALEKLLTGEVDKIVLTRPVVEAGENLGYLPGTLEEKLDPYLKPLMEAIEDHVGPVGAKRLLAAGKLKIEPLAFMRGRTFNRSVMLLDEAQNTSQEQMRMFLTRAGYECQIIITGDVTQSDLVKPRDAASDWSNGLQFVINKTAGRDINIGHVEFQHRDVVRSEMVKRLLYLLDGPRKAMSVAPVVIDESSEG